ncbi:MAG: hypothetical protein MUE44_21420 [Oscillatoriaceae cyanobacterium Prado104]|jgi:hypothetical protein|nr:hypothetical protein [Oscillatoriaceae cyanobacterium Prado104]
MVGQTAFDRVQLILAGMSIALSLQLGQPVAALANPQTALQTAQNSSTELAERAMKEGLRLYQQGTLEAKKRAIAQFEIALNGTYPRRG